MKLSSSSTSSSAGKRLARANICKIKAPEPDQDSMINQRNFCHAFELLRQRSNLMTIVDASLHSIAAIFSTTDERHHFHLTKQFSPLQATNDQRQLRVDQGRELTTWGKNWRNNCCTLIQTPIVVSGYSAGFWKPRFEEEMHALTGTAVWANIESQI